MPLRQFARLLAAAEMEPLDEDQCADPAIDGGDRMLTESREEELQRAVAD